MSMPTLGRTVLYKLAEFDARAIKSSRPQNDDGRSNDVSEGDVYPATVVRTFGGPAVNLQVHLDGVDTHWATSRTEGDQPGQWAWPTRVEA